MVAFGPKSFFQRTRTAVEVYKVMTGVVGLESAREKLGGEETEVLGNGEELRLVMEVILGGG